MTLLCPNAQNFYVSHCAPLFDKYREDQTFIVSTSDGTNWFDVQLAMLKESDSFDPVVNDDDKVIGFTMERYPQYVFADTRDIVSDASKIPDIFLYAMHRLVDSGERSSILTFHGFRDVYIGDNPSAALADS